MKFPTWTSPVLDGILFKTKTIAPSPVQTSRHVSPTSMATFPDVNGKFLCELLASDKYNNSDKFITSKEFHHFHIPVSETPFILN